MRLIRERRIALLVSAAAALLTGIPYLIALSAAPGDTSFNGFLLNPVDGFTYLAKMKQGVDGYWSLILPYAPDPGPRAILYIYYLFLGHLSRITSLDPIWIFHVARLGAATTFFYFVYLLNERISSHRNIRWFGFGLTLIGSGLGWISLFLGSVVSSDMLVPESIPFLVAYGNAHFPLAAAALVSGILAAVAEGWLVWKRIAVAVTSGFILGALLPFSFVSLLAILGVYTLLELWNGIRRKPSRGNVQAAVNMGITLVANSVGALPWLIYDLWLSLRHPVISSWNEQNQTPSPSPVAYLLGFGPLLILGAVGVMRARPWRSGQGRLLIVWLLSGALLLYAPLAFQRRLSLGLAIPLSILAAWGWGSISMPVSRRRVLAAVLMGFMSITNILVVFIGVTGVVRGEPAVTYAQHEIASYDWIDENVPQGDLVLAGSRTGNRLPAFADVRVLYGHPFETPDAEVQEALVKSLYQLPGISLSDLKSMGIRWVYFGSEERLLGEPAWLTDLEVRWENGDIAVLEVPTG